jgi:hypothetical protein
MAPLRASAFHDDSAAHAASCCARHARPGACVACASLSHARERAPRVILAFRRDAGEQSRDFVWHGSCLDGSARGDTGREQAARRGPTGAAVVGPIVAGRCPLPRWRAASHSPREVGPRRMGRRSAEPFMTDESSPGVIADATDDAAPDGGELALRLADVVFDWQPASSAESAPNAASCRRARAHWMSHRARCALDTGR